MNEAFKLVVSKEGIAELKFDLPQEKVNKFSLPVLEELERHLDALSTNTSVKALKLTSGKQDVFIAGADLHAFEPTFEHPEIAEKMIKKGHLVFSKLQSLPFPTIAVIHGVCVGGGLEFSLSCTYRIVSDHPKTILGLPEVTLGIFPGWGGTQRLPRLVGLSNGLNMILTGKAIPAIKAWKMHLADAIVASDFIEAKSNEFIQQILKPEGAEKVKARRTKRPLGSTILESNPLGRALIYSQAKKALIEKTKGYMPAPMIALDVIKQTYSLPLQEGLKKEAEIFVANIPNGLTQAKDLIRLFFIQEAAKKDPGAPDGMPVDIKSAAVLGAGTMGAPIAWLLADHSLFTRLKDVTWEIVGKGIGSIKVLFDKGLKVRKITPCELSRRFQLISGTIDYSGFEHAELVIEAATENLDLKKKIFQEVESVVKPDTIIASNTSSLTVAEMSQGLKNPDRFIAMHFFNPVHKMPLVEIVGGPKSSPQAIATAVSLCKKLGKTPLVVKDCAGFLVNRILMQGSNEVLLMLEEGYSEEVLNNALLDFGMPMGPFILSDEIGNDVIYKVTLSFEKAYGERMNPAKLLKLMTERELYGKKNGRGFYLYKGKQATQNPEISSLLNSINRFKTDLPKEEILPRFLYSMINEASRCLEEGIISRADFLDLALITGIGFPPFRGGLLCYADKIGVAPIVSTLKQFEKTYGMRFKPSALLEEMARTNRPFYP